MGDRKSGILLPISSLNSPFGVGDFGPAAFRFVSFLKESGQSFWQILPLTPTAPIFGNSPYNSTSAFAGNLLYISPESLCKDGWISKKTLFPKPAFSSKEVMYEEALQYKQRLLKEAFVTMQREHPHEKAFEAFCRENEDWLEDFATFNVLRQEFQGKIWREWPRPYRDRNRKALAEVKERFSEQLYEIKFQQFIFAQQWQALKEECRLKGVQVIGDLPIYVNYDSADVWSHTKLFILDRHKKPRFVAGVPPDYFSATGQRWGNPVYDWQQMKKESFQWWIRRVMFDLKLYDWVRIDHFRGFVGSWHIPEANKTAIGGRWQKVPGKSFFKLLCRHQKYLPIIAEDLGVITPDVVRVMKEFRFPGMKVLLFAFSGNSDNPYLPEKYPVNCIVYTGTHDNNTSRGWFRKEASAKEKQVLFRYLGKKVSEKDIAWKLIEVAFHSRARIAIIPMQDILGLDERARINVPAVSQNNWRWRLPSNKMTSAVRKSLFRLTKTSRRLP